MDVRDYLIDHASFDWTKLLVTWQWRLPPRFTAWLMNRFGDLFLRTDDGQIHVLRLDDGSLRCLATSKEQFLAMVDANADDWLMIPLVDRLVAAGCRLRQGQCYAFVRIPLIGGDYSVENVAVREVAFQYNALGPIFQQIDGLPDGTPVEFLFTDESHG